MEYSSKTWQLTAALLVCMISGITSLELRESFIENSEDEKCDSEYSCKNCSTVKICARDWKGRLTKQAEFKCGSDAPFCDYSSGTCRSHSTNDTCAPVVHDFLCSSDGYFPNPSNCQKYYVCVKGVAYEHSCDYTYYNPLSENCQHEYSCYTIDCLDKSGVKVAHGASAKFFGYCMKNALVRFDKCPGQFELDENLQTCVATCHEEGEQADPYDCTKFYKCFYSASRTTLQISHNKCPEGEVYDPLNFHCSPPSTQLACQSGHIHVSHNYLSRF